VTDPDRFSAAALELLESVAIRADAAGRIEPPGGAAVLRSIVEATVALFDAEAASIALHDAATDRLIFRVAAGEHGQGVVGLSIAPHEGVAGYVFSTGQPIAIADVAADPRFGSTTAEQTGYVPRSLLAVPLLDDENSLGVLEILDRRSSEGFGLRDVELASVFARQATVAIRATRLERDTAALLHEALSGLLAAGATAADADAIEEIVSAVTERLAADADAPVWALADRVARLRAADPDQVTLLRDLLDVLVRRADRRAGGQTPGRYSRR
jgi:GAF domain-containing protein